MVAPPMSDSKDISEDRGFKALFSAYPQETIEVFAPELLTERGKPAAVTVLQQESVLPDLGDTSRFLDIALLATWLDGSHAVILLVEHWSEARKVDLRRVNWYVADLALRHPHVAVFPVVLVTDPSPRAVLDRWEMSVAGMVTVSLQVRVYRVTPLELPRLRSLQSRVAAILTILAVQDAVEAVAAALEHMARSPGPLDDLERFLPFAMKLARMQESDAPRFRRRLEEAGMVNVLTELKEEARAEARAEALAQASRATVASVHRLVDRGVLTRDAARAELTDLIDTGAITREIGQGALSLLG